MEETLRHKLRDLLQQLTDLFECSESVHYRIYTSWGKVRLKLTLTGDRVITITLEGEQFAEVTHILKQLANDSVEGDL